MPNEGSNQVSNESSISFKEKRIRSLTQLYYSRPEIQKAIFEFSKNREISPRYYEGFGKRPDAFQYPTEVFDFAKKGATSFHCSEELWSDPLEIKTGMNEKQLNELRTGWDLLIDIDSRYIDYSKIMAQIIIKMLHFHGIKNLGIKFSGSKGFHIIIPWKAFPKEISGIKTSDKFPEYPRIITNYIMTKTKNQLIEKISELERPNKYVKDYRAPKEVMPDLILVSPRHLFRMPYSLHEKTALCSTVINEDELEDFQLRDAEPMKVHIRNFMPDAKEGEASELLMQALDWHRENNPEETTQVREYKKIQLTNLSENQFPPCVKNILKGMGDGKKRALFVLINLFRSIGMDKDELEKRIYDWNEKNEVPLKKGYIKSQISWALKRKSIMPPNCKEFYQGIAVCQPDNYCKLIKNPVNYVVRKNLVENKSKSNGPNNSPPKKNNKFKKKN